MTIHTDCPVTFDPEACRYTGAIRADAFKLFTDLAFRSLVSQYAPTAEAVERDYAVVEAAGIDALVGDLRAAGQFALHVVTDGDSPMRATLVGLSVSTKACQARYVPLAHTHGTTDAAPPAAAQGGLFDDEPAIAGPGRATAPGEIDFAPLPTIDSSAQARYVSSSSAIASSSGSERLASSR